jgi:hypothetical protein
MSSLPRFLAATLLLAAAVFSTGCSTTLARIDQHNLRGGMMRYQEDQIMDNLIRTRKSLPIVHYNITKMDAKVQTVVGATGNGSESLLNLATSGFSTATRALGWVTNGSRTNDITVTADAVLDKPAVYSAYYHYARRLNGGDGLRSEPRHTRRADRDTDILGRVWRDGHYYYIPAEYAEPFSKLVMRVTAVQGEVPKARSPIDFEVPVAGSAGRTGYRSPMRPAPSETNAGSGIRALQDAADELRKLRLLR